MRAKPTTLPGCAEDIPAARATESYEQAQAAIKKAGEHPSNSDLAVILPLLRSAALSGHVKAQLRYGSYVVGFWMTDEMFWPKDKPNAVTALAMLRVVARRDPMAAKEWYGGLAKDPVDLKEDPLSRLPKAWIELALKEAQEWERCHPVPPPTP